MAFNTSNTSHGFKLKSILKAPKEPIRDKIEVLNQFIATGSLTRSQVLKFLKINDSDFDWFSFVQNIVYQETPANLIFGGMEETKWIISSIPFDFNIENIKIKKASNTPEISLLEFSKLVISTIPNAKTDLKSFTTTILDSYSISWRNKFWPCLSTLVYCFERLRDFDSKSSCQRVRGFLKELQEFYDSKPFYIEELDPRVKITQKSSDQKPADPFSRIQNSKAQRKERLPLSETHWSKSPKKAKESTESVIFPLQKILPPLQIPSTRNPIPSTQQIVNSTKKRPSFGLFVPEFYVTPVITAHAIDITPEIQQAISSRESTLQNANNDFEIVCPSSSSSDSERTDLEPENTPAILPPVPIIEEITSIPKSTETAITNDEVKEISMEICQEQDQEKEPQIENTGIDAAQDDKEETRTVEAAPSTPVMEIAEEPVVIIEKEKMTEPILIEDTNQNSEQEDVRIVEPSNLPKKIAIDLVSEKKNIPAPSVVISLSKFYKGKSSKSSNSKANRKRLSLVFEKNGKRLGEKQKTQAFRYFEKLWIEHSKNVNRVISDQDLQYFVKHGLFP